MEFPQQAMWMLMAVSKVGTGSKRANVLSIIRRTFDYVVVVKHVVHVLILSKTTTMIECISSIYMCWKISMLSVLMHVINEHTYSHVQSRTDENFWYRFFPVWSSRIEPEIYGMSCIYLKPIQIFFKTRIYFFPVIIPDASEEMPGHLDQS